MKGKKDWKGFQSLIDARSDYRTLLYSEDPSKKALWMELLDWENRINHCASQIRRAPMPSELNDVRLTRSSLHIDQNMAFCHFLELLFEHSLRSEDGEALNLLFSFLEAYTDLLTREVKWCQ